jgi:hypothetical protein
MAGRTLRRSGEQVKRGVSGGFKPAIRNDRRRAALYYAAPPMRSPAALSFVLALFVAGCAPKIGDGCNTGLDCSINNDRACDTAAPGGLCTIYGCEAGTCPDNAVCVQWRPNESRLTFNACMPRCNGDAGCRVDEGYRCTADYDVIDPSTGETLARTLEEDAPLFCIAVIPE